MTRNSSSKKTDESDSRDVLRVAVVSDLHAHDKAGDEAPSSLDINETDHSVNVDPIAGLTDLISRERLSADLLVCAGDLADLAKPPAIQHAWECIAKIQKALSARHLVATAGNHDVDSRHKDNKYDAKGFLQQLKPRFPVSGERLFDRYWSRHFAIQRKQSSNWSYRIITLNSSAYHGEAPAKGELEEFRHGRISKWTLDALSIELQKADPATLSILVCHHPPHFHADHGLGEADTMKGGQQLLDLLGSNGEWLVIHGHKHHPKVSYAAGTSAQSPVVFAAAPLCGEIWKKLQGSTRNQFYILSFPLSKFDELGLVGRFSAWDWISPYGWKAATPDSGLPHTGGFGCREKSLVLAKQIAKSIKKGSSVTWGELCDHHSKLHFLTPETLRQLRTQLLTEYQISSHPDVGGIHTLERGA